MNYDVRSGSILFKHSRDEIPNPDDQRFKPHSHGESYELFYFIEGDAEYSIGDQTYDLRNGSMLLVKPGVIHHIILKSLKPYERITIRFRSEDVNKNIREKLLQTENIYFVRNTEISNEILRLDVHYTNLDKDWILYAFMNSLQVILSYVANYQPLETNFNFSGETKRIIDYIDDNLTSIQSLGQICNDLHISKSAISKRFTESVGVPIMTYVRVRKCIVANSLIEKGEKPTEVYKSCGFNDYTSFYRAYKKVFRREPSKLKK